MTSETTVDRGERWLTPGVRGIGAASLLSDLGHEVPTALLPSLLTTTLGAPASALGLIEGVADGLAGVARLSGGALADDPGRRRAVAVGGYTSTAVLSGLIGAATAAWQVGVLRAAAWTARGLRVPAPPGPVAGDDRGRYQVGVVGLAAGVRQTPGHGEERAGSAMSSHTSDQGPGRPSRAAHRLAWLVTEVLAPAPLAAALLLAMAWRSYRPWPGVAAWWAPRDLMALVGHPRRPQRDRRR